MKRAINLIISITLQSLMIAGLFLYKLPQAKAQAVFGLVAAYGFEEGSGINLVDQSGNLNHGTLLNGPVWVTTGKYGKALRFDGNNDLVSIPDSNSLDLTTSMTLEAWVYPMSALSGWDTVILKEYDTGLIYALYANGDGNLSHTYITSSGSEYGTGGGSALPINTWTHLAATYDGVILRLFINGNQVNTISRTGTIQTSSRGLGIGGNLIWSNEGFPGLIDEVRIYNRALVASEIITDMQTPVTGITPTASASPTRTTTSTVTSLPSTPTLTRTATHIPTVIASLSSTVTLFPSSPTLAQTLTRTPTIFVPLSSTATSTRTATLTPSVIASPSSTPVPTLTYTSVPNPTTIPGAYIYPLKPSLNGRYFVDQNNFPFFINGDTPWSLIGQVSQEDAEFYMQDAVSKGINSIIVTLTESYYADNAPANYYGIQPFTIPNNFTTPNEEYFTHADWVINKAAQYGLQVILAPNYLGCCNDGWWDELMNNNSVSNATWYGNFIGNRYKDFPNLMYVWGNDVNPCGVNSTVASCSQRDKIKAMAQAVSAADPNHLHTYHGTPEYSALDVFNPLTDPWLTANITYTYQPVQIKSLQDYNRSPIMPFFLFESHYERDWANAAPIQVRRQVYVAVLSGAAGHHYGNNPIWHMNGMPGDSTNTWKQHLNDEARSDLSHIRALFESRAWYSLVPDQNHTVITAGVGSATGSDYVGAAQTSDKATVIAYIPLQKQVTLDMTKISGSTAKCWWFNPRDGTALLIGSYSTTGLRNFTPPTNDDWVLVVDNDTLNLSAPGSGTVPTPVPLITSTPSSTASQTPSPSSTATIPPISATFTPSHTATLTPTMTGTSTPSPTSASVVEVIYLSSTTNGTVSGVAFADEDILAHNEATGAWSMYFDGSDVGITSDVDAFALMPNGTILISLDSDVTVGSLGTVDDSDIIEFTPTSLGSNTTGSFVRYFDGSDVGLTATTEDIDTIDFAPDGRLIVSVRGSFSLTGVSGNDEDLITFTPTLLGSNTSGTWSLYFDGSDVGLNDSTSEQINEIWINPLDNKIYLTTIGAFTVTGLTGSSSDVFICTPGSLGATTTCTFSSYWIGSLNGFTGEIIDGLDIVK